MRSLDAGLSADAHLTSGLGDAEAELDVCTEFSNPLGMSFPLGCCSTGAFVMNLDNFQHAGTSPVCHHQDINTVRALNS